MKIVSDASATARVVSVLESFVRESTTAHAVRHGTDIHELAQSGPVS